RNLSRSDGDFGQRRGCRRCNSGDVSAGLSAYRPVSRRSQVPNLVDSNRREYSALQTEKDTAGALDSPGDSWREAGTWQHRCRSGNQSRGTIFQERTRWPGQENLEWYASYLPFRAFFAGGRKSFHRNHGTGAGTDTRKCTNPPPPRPHPDARTLATLFGLIH